MRNRNLWQALRAILNQLEDHDEQVWTDHQGLHTASGDGGVIWDTESHSWVMYVNVHGDLVDQLL